MKFLYIWREIIVKFFQVLFFIISRISFTIYSIFYDDDIYKNTKFLYIWREIIVKFFQILFFVVSRISSIVIRIRNTKFLYIWREERLSKFSKFCSSSYHEFLLLYKVSSIVIKIRRNERWRRNYWKSTNDQSCHI